MSTSAGARQGSIEWAWAGSPLADDVSGDRHAVAADSRTALVAAIDRLGHGAEAAEASQLAAEVVAAHWQTPLVELIERCHARLRKTRGVVMSLAAFDAERARMRWTGVGNVEGVLLRAVHAMRAREVLALRGGVIGYQLPPLRVWTLPLSAGDTLILTTDGIRSGYVAGLMLHESPQQIATQILATYAKGSDDALVVVARYLGATT